jgi:hypothetical protein
MTSTQAIDYLNAHGEPIYEAPAKWRSRGFAYYAPNVGQMLTEAHLIELALNMQALAR